VLLALLAALTVLPALLIGSVHAASQITVLALCGLALAVQVYRRRTRPSSLPQAVRPFLWGMILAVGWTALQVISLPPSLVRFLSPEAARLLALSDESGGSRWLTLSLSAHNTHLELAKQMSCVAVFIVAAGFLHRSARARTVLRTFFVAG